MFVAPAAAALALAALAQAALPAAGPASRTGRAAGVAWDVPARWTSGKASAMRVASYGIPATRSGPAECAVFHFGQGEGGSVDANVERWGRQFEGAPQPRRSPATVAGLRVTRVEVSGTYLAPGGPMMQSTGKRPGYRLLGAIVEAPRGNVFFKLTGPAAAVAAAAPELDALIASLRKE